MTQASRPVLVEFGLQKQVYYQNKILYAQLDNLPLDGTLRYPTQSKTLSNKENTRRLMFLYKLHCKTHGIDVTIRAHTVDGGVLFVRIK